MARSPIRPPGSGSSGTPAVLTPASMPASGSRSAPRQARPGKRQPPRSPSARPVRCAPNAWPCRCGTGISASAASGAAWSRPNAPPCAAADGRLDPQRRPARKEDTMEGPRPEYTAELLRHFADLRDGTHGGASSRRDKERLFAPAVALLDPHARQALGEINTDLLLGTGAVTRTGVRVRGDGVDAIWALSWPEQQAAGISPVVLRAYYGVGAHHPHLQGGTVGDWPLNVFDERQAAAELPTLRAIASADLHNLVFQRDYRIIPAIVSGWAARSPA